jgi:predicted RNA-binding Zn-ribbon protein involved in translation (DUF1610 family)
MKFTCPHCGKEIEIEVKGIVKIHPNYPDKKKEEDYKT